MSTATPGAEAPKRLIPNQVSLIAYMIVPTQGRSARLIWIQRAPVLAGEEAHRQFGEY